MFLTMMKGKIHRATVTQAELNYIGSITVDEALLEAAGILENERVQVVNLNNGSRFETYAIKGAKNKAFALKKTLVIPKTEVKKDKTFLSLPAKKQTLTIITLTLKNITSQSFQFFDNCFNCFIPFYLPN